MPSIRVQGLERDIEVESGTDLLTACRTQQVNLFWGTWAKAFNCRGKGLCSLCKVEVLEGGDRLTPPTKREAKRLRNKPDTWRIACCAKVRGDVAIDTFPVRHAADRVSEEALHRATLPEDERNDLERADWEALKPEPAEKKEKGPKKGLFAKVRKSKGIDDSDVERQPGAPLEETEGAEDKASSKRKGLLGGKGKKKDKAGKGKAKETGKSKAGGKDPAKAKEKGLKVKKGAGKKRGDGGAEAPDSGAETAAEGKEPAAKKGFGLKGKR